MKGRMGREVYREKGGRRGIKIKGGKEEREGKRKEGDWNKGEERKGREGEEGEKEEEREGRVGWEERDGR